MQWFDLQERWLTSVVRMGHYLGKGYFSYMWPACPEVKAKPPRQRFESKVERQCWKTVKLRTRKLHKKRCSVESQIRNKEGFMSPYPANLKKKSCVGVLCNQTIYKLCDKIKSRGGQGLRQASAMLDQSHYVNQLVCAVGGVLVFVAKTE